MGRFWAAEQHTGSRPFGVGAAGMIDVAGRVPARGAIDGFAGADLEQVLAAALGLLLGGQRHAAILNNARAFGDGALGEEAETGL